MAKCTCAEWKYILCEFIRRANVSAQSRNHARAGVPTAMNFTERCETCKRSCWTILIIPHEFRSRRLRARHILVIFNFSTILSLLPLLVPLSTLKSEFTCEPSETNRGPVIAHRHCDDDDDNDEQRNNANAKMGEKESSREKNLIRNVWRQFLRVFFCSFQLHTAFIALDLQ